jgi:hypothetical protein
MHRPQHSDAQQVTASHADPIKRARCSARTCLFESISMTVPATAAEFVVASNFFRTHLTRYSRLTFKIED